MKSILSFRFLVFLFCLPFYKQLVAQNNWACFPNTGTICPNYVNVGDMDIAGTQLTVEAVYAKTTDNHSLCYTSETDLVSKHKDTHDVNYLLRTFNAQLSTSDGYYVAVKPGGYSSINTNECHHVAMVYDGSWLKFYFDGNVVDSTAATGTMKLNDWNTKIGFYASDTLVLEEQFFGYMDEVRIWNVARTRTEIRQYMFTELPNPASQTGLVGYYKFNNDFRNLQGNSTYDGVVTGDVQRLQNPYCNPIVLDTTSTGNPGCHATINGNSVISAGENTTLTVDATGTYYWYPSYGLSCTNCQSPVANPQVSTMYYVQVTDSLGCVAMDSILIEVGCDIYIPNAFSPNIDGQNDVFLVKSNCLLKDVSFVIYDRWGEKVFETDDISKGWDGIYNGKPAIEGVYVYHFSATSADGRKFSKQGNISMIR